MRKIWARSWEVRFDSRVRRSLEILWSRGRVFHAGVTTLKMRDLEKPVGYQIILAGFPFGMACLTNLLIRAIVALIPFAQLSNHTLSLSARKGALLDAARGLL